jgi:hypothetical protein
VQHQKIFVDDEKAFVFAFTDENGGDGMVEHNSCANFSEQMLERIRR